MSATVSTPVLSTPVVPDAVVEATPSSPAQPRGASARAASAVARPVGERRRAAARGERWSEVRVLADVVTLRESPGVREFITCQQHGVVIEADGRNQARPRAIAVGEFVEEPDLDRVVSRFGHERRRPRCVRWQWLGGRLSAVAIVVGRAGLVEQVRALEVGAGRGQTLGVGERRLVPGLATRDPDEGASFECVLDASGEMGAYGDPCENFNTCDPGLACLNPEYVPDCKAGGCCSPFCDTSEANTCPGDGQKCIAWFEEGMAPPGYETVGVCGVPQ